MLTNNGGTAAVVLANMLCCVQYIAKLRRDIDALLLEGGENSVRTRSGTTSNVDNAIQYVCNTADICCQCYWMLPIRV
jgi:hypothetical protein